MPVDGKLDAGRPGGPDSADVIFEDFARLIAPDTERPEKGLGAEAPFELADNVTGICRICHRVSFTYTWTTSTAASVLRTMLGISSAVTGF
jgi:hypothetical protein